MYKNKAGDGQLLLSNSKKIVQISSGAKTAQMLGPTFRPVIQFAYANPVHTTKFLIFQNKLFPY